MATDYDAPRTKDEDSTDSLEELKGQSSKAQTSVIDAEDDTVEGVDLPGADLSNEQLIVKVVPQQDEEFTCMSCFLVRHHFQIGRESGGQKFCRECES